MGVGCLGLLMLVCGLCVQSWAGGVGNGATFPPGTSPPDTTIASWMSALLLSVACTAFAFIAPRGDAHWHFTRSMQLAFGLEAFFWLLVLCHLLFPEFLDVLPKELQSEDSGAVAEDNKTHESVIMVAIDVVVYLVLPMVAGLTQVYSALCGLHDDGYGAFLGSKTRLAIWLGGACSCLVFGLALETMKDVTDIPLWVTLVSLVLKYGSGAVAITAVGVVLKNYPFPCATLVSAVLAIAVLLFEPRPFQSSTVFNDRALAHTLLLFNALFSFLSLFSIISMQTAFSKIENWAELQAPELMEGVENLTANLTESMVKVKDRRCCS